MTYLIALIIAIALGAVIALLSFSNIGSGFSGQSEKAQAQVFANAVSQVEIALSAFNATNGISSLTQADFEQELKDANWLRTDLQVPSFAGGSSYTLESDVNDVYTLTLAFAGSACSQALTELAEDVSSIECSVVDTNVVLTATVF